MTSETAVQFNQLGLKDSIVKVLNEVGYETPSPIQAQTIPLLLQGRDVLGQAQTGTGKTATIMGYPELGLGLLPRMFTKNTYYRL